MPPSTAAPDPPVRLSLSMMEGGISGGGEGASGGTDGSGDGGGLGGGGRGGGAGGGEGESAAEGDPEGEAGAGADEFECERGCGFRGTFRAVETHEEGCTEAPAEEEPLWPHAAARRLWLDYVGDAPTTARVAVAVSLLRRVHSAEWSAREPVPIYQRGSGYSK
mmetsp:Transcript_11748/g.37482  ORF Transcript_11748/g.37482 Transcript_11748/m.37482 type:complete len:164 (-) Transcript_11748:200-691(-)